MALKILWQELQHNEGMTSEQNMEHSLLSEIPSNIEQDFLVFVISGERLHFVICSSTSDPETVALGSHCFVTHSETHEFIAMNEIALTAHGAIWPVI